MNTLASTAGEASKGLGERGTEFLLALFLGAIQLGWLGLLLWVIYQIAVAI
jgi:hypothetical protein